MVRASVDRDVPGPVGSDEDGPLRSRDFDALGLESILEPSLELAGRLPLGPGDGPDQGPNRQAAVTQFLPLLRAYSRDNRWPR